MPEISFHTRPVFGSILELFQLARRVNKKPDMSVSTPAGTDRQPTIKNERLTLSALWRHPESDLRRQELAAELPQNTRIEEEKAAILACQNGLLRDRFVNLQRLGRIYSPLPVLMSGGVIGAEYVREETDKLMRWVITNNRFEDFLCVGENRQAHLNMPAFTSDSQESPLPSAIHLSAPTTGPVQLLEPHSSLFYISIGEVVLIQNAVLESTFRESLKRFEHKDATGPVLFLKSSLGLIPYLSYSSILAAQQTGHTHVLVKIFGTAKLFASQTRYAIDQLVLAESIDQDGTITYARNLLEGSRV